MQHLEKIKGTKAEVKINANFQFSCKKFYHYTPENKNLLQKSVNIIWCFVLYFTFCKLIISKKLEYMYVQ